MCLVDVEGSPKPVASCAMPINDGMSIHTNTQSVKKAREGVMEFLLINHPLDCPVCDQGGECDLQDQTVAFGPENSRFEENKRSVDEKHMGPLIKTYMTRCIHCTRCIRFADEVAGVNQLGAVNRGENMEITTYLEKSIDSELSANIVDLCPVGALTSKPYQFEARPWELKKTQTIDVMDGVGSNVRVDTYGWKVKRVLPVLNEDINEEWISDKTRYACDGLLNQRIDTPLIKKDKKFTEISWNEALGNLKEDLLTTKPEEVAFLLGDFVDLETAYLTKKLADDLNIKTIECRQEGCKIPFNHRSQFLFNSKIKGIDETDCILIIGSNIREEAAIINSRIRKNIVSKNIPIALIGNNVDLTYDYDYLGNDINIITDILNEKNPFSDELLRAKKPMVIIGQSVLNRDDSLQIYSLLETFTDKFNLIQDEWNGFNILQLTAARAGGLEVGAFQRSQSLDDILDSSTDKYRIIISVGADEVNYDKLSNSKIIYIGTHGDRGANAAQLILPSAAYTEKDSIYINTEGRVQFANKASFPPGDAKEDWKIINQLSELMKLDWSFISQTDVRDAIFSDFPHLTEDFNELSNGFIKILDNKTKDENEFVPKDTRSIKEKKSDTLNGNIKEFEENSAQKIFKSYWKDLNDRQREYLRKYNYPESWSEFTEYFGFKVVNDIKKKNNVILPYEESYAESLGKSWDDLTYNQKKWAYTKRNKNNLIGLADDATFTPEGIVVLNDNQEAYYAEPKEIFFENKRLTLSINDFYINDSISRHSNTMAECSRARNEIRNPIKVKAS
tara:strand:- start:2588 stop:4957 length:2370 start_codon:yes stop_codon:yes gene_type:complete